MNFDNNDIDAEKFRKSLSDAERKEAVNKMDSWIAEGRAKAFRFVGGPHDGSDYYIVSKDGKPKRQIICLFLNMVVKLGVQYEAAEYEFNDEKNIFEYTGKIVKKIAGDKNAHDSN